jgi:exosortase/archaeosortase family protein
MGPVKKYLESLKKDLKSQKGMKNATRFVAIFLLSFLLFLYVVIPLTGSFWDGMGILHAQAVGSLLSAWGIESTINGNILTMAVQGQNVDFVISQLCSGDVEIALLISLLIASFEVLLIWRLGGAFLGSLLLLLLNPVRIAITLVITKDSGLEAGDFYHSVIFRLFLFVILVLYYFIWYHLTIKRKCKLQKKLCKKFKRLCK